MDRLTPPDRPAPTPLSQLQSTGSIGSTGAERRAASWRVRGQRGPSWELPEKYETKRVIGTGGMGSVLLARDRNLGRLVAIKVLFTECTDYLERLRQEARVLARLDHPAIVRVHELDVHEGRLFLAMEYVPGGNLTLARLGPAELVRTLRGVVDALAHAHENGVVHRDVKPENVLLTKAVERDRGARGRAVLTDFGLATGAGEGPVDARQAIVGTPVTMSPEQTRGERVTAASDQFSLGVTFYRQLTGRWPFRGRTLVDVFEAIQERAPEPLATDGRPCPRGLEAIVLRMLAKDPAERFGSMQELGRALDRHARARTLLSLPRTLWRRGRRRREAGGSDVHPPDLT